MIDKQHPINPSDLVRMIPGVDVAFAGAGFFGRRITMRQPFGRGVCQPTMYVDGFMYLPDELTLDDVVGPDEIEGIEVYARQSQAPPQFTNSRSGCGSIVVWTRLTPRTRK